MKAQELTVTIAELNTGNEIEVQIKLEDEYGTDRIPTEIMYINTTGAEEIGVIYLDSDAEKTVRTNNPDMFDFIPLDSGRSNSALPTSIEYIIIKKISGTATADLRIFTMNFIRKNDDN